MKRNQNFLGDVVGVLIDFGNRINVDVVGADSIKGLILSLRYGLGSGPAIIVGKKVFKGDDIDLNAVKNYISFILENAEEASIA